MGELAIPELVDFSSVRVTGIACDGDRLYTTELPYVLAPACIMCHAPTLEKPCDTCGLSYCVRCLPCPNCVATPTTTTTPSPRVTEIESGSTGSTTEWALAEQPANLYEELATSSKSTFALDAGFLVRRPLPLGRIYIEDELGHRAFGTSHADFTRLCQELSWWSNIACVIMLPKRCACGNVLKLRSERQLGLCGRLCNNQPRQMANTLACR